MLKCACTNGWYVTAKIHVCVMHDVTHYDTLAVIFPIVSHVMIQSDEAGFLVMLCKKLIMYEKSRT